MENQRVMPKIFKQSDYAYKADEKALPPFGILTGHPRLSVAAQSKNLVFDMRSLPPGSYSFPYHFHRNAEELMMIVSGTLTLRTPEGLRVINEGDILYFGVGEHEAHQFYNHGEIPCVYLDLRTLSGIDISDYPDTGKVNILPFNELYNQEGRTTYNQGEEGIEEIWRKLKEQ